MSKIKCSKYPIEKCKNYESGTYQRCEYCKHNLYHSIESFKNAKDHFIDNKLED
jgi:hypothetical protein